MVKIRKASEKNSIGRLRDKLRTLLFVVFTIIGITNFQYEPG